MISDARVASIFDLLYTLRMSPAQICNDSVSLEFLKMLAKERFGDMVKVVVDLKRKKLAIGAGLHADEQKMLLEDGSVQEDLWGANIYPEKAGDDFIEVDSMINMRPNQGNRSRDITDPLVRKAVIDTIHSLISV